MLLCNTDIDDNVLNNNYNGYYKPYFIEQQGEIILKGIPVPKSWLYYKNNFFVKYSYFNNFILEKFICFRYPCFSTHNYKITGNILNEFMIFCNLHNCQLIICIAKDDDARNFEKNLKNNNLFFLNLANNNVRSENDFHWNKKGHEYVANKIYNFLKEENMIN